MVIFAPAIIEACTIYHRVRNEEKKLTVVSDLRLVAGKSKWWCKTADVFCDHLTTFEGG